VPGDREEKAPTAETLEDALREAGVGSAPSVPVSTAVQDADALGPLAPDEREIERREAAVKIEKLTDAVDDITEGIMVLHEPHEV
jgi:hypothetical protein